VIVYPRGTAFASRLAVVSIVVLNHIGEENSPVIDDGTRAPGYRRPFHSRPTSLAVSAATASVALFSRANSNLNSFSHAPLRRRHR
jgi:hypothetical protein